MSKADELVSIAVKPRATRAGVACSPEGTITVRVHAPAAEGAANRECVALLAAALGVPKTSITIVRGEKGRRKQIAVAGLEAAEVARRLAGKDAGHE